MNDTTDHYEGAILEEVRDQITRLAEAMSEVPGKVRNIDERLGTIESDVKVIKAAVTDQTSELNMLGTRLARLEDLA